MQIKSLESPITALKGRDMARLGQKEGNVTGGQKVIFNSLRQKLVLVALWKTDLSLARQNARKKWATHRFVFAQLANGPALPGSLVREIANERIHLVYVPARFEGSDVNEELYEFASNALDAQARQLADADEGSSSVDTAAAAAMRSRMQQQTVPSSSDIRELARDFYEANKFEGPGHRLRLKS